MAAEVTPEPKPAEREAILRALRGLGGNRVPEPYASAWRRAGLAENALGGFGETPLVGGAPLLVRRQGRREPQ